MGGEKLIYGGFIYTKCKDGKDKRYWRCENWRSDKCHGTATTDNNNSVTVGQEHNFILRFFIIVFFSISKNISKLFGGKSKNSDGKKNTKMKMRRDFVTT